MYVLVSCISWNVSCSQRGTYHDHTGTYSTMETGTPLHYPPPRDSIEDMFLQGLHYHPSLAVYTLRLLFSCIKNPLVCLVAAHHSQASRRSSYKPMGEDPAPTKGDSDKQSDRRECVKVTLPAKTMTVLGSDHPLFLCDWPVLGDLIMT